MRSSSDILPLNLKPVVTFSEMEAKDKHISNILIKIGRFCGFYPLEKPSRLGVFYQIFMLCFTFGVSVFCIVTIANTSYTSITTLHVFIDVLTSTFITIQGCSIQIISLLYPAAWRRLSKELNIATVNNEKQTRGFIFEILLLHVIFAVKYVSCAMVWTRVVGWWLYKYYIFRAVHDYYAFITILLIVHTNLIIKKRFNTMNEVLKNTPKIFIVKFEPQLQIRQIECAYRKLLVVLEHFNSVFGYQILFIMGNTVALVLQSLCYVLKHTENIWIVSWSVIITLFALVFYKQISFFYRILY